MPLIVLRGDRVLLLHLLQPLGLLLLHRVPAAALHLPVDVLLHAQRVVERGVEGLVHLRRGRLDAAVHEEIAHALGVGQQILRNKKIEIRIYR